MGTLGVLWGFVKALPQLMRIYDQLKELFGDNLAKVEADLEIQVNLIRQSKEPGITIEKKRELRVEALKAGNNMFSRIA
jgi:hypothetical protein